jgi:hypothetical protein
MVVKGERSMGFSDDFSQMIMLGKHKVTSKEQVDAMLDHLVGAYGYKYTWLISFPLIGMILCLFGFFIVATKANILIGAIFILLALLISFKIIQIVHDKLVVTEEKVIHQSPFRFLCWELDRKNIMAIGYEAAQKQGEHIIFESADGMKRRIELHGPFKERFIGFVPKAQRRWGSE